MNRYEVDIHFKPRGWDSYAVNATTADNARYTAVKRVINECGQETANNIDLIRIYKSGTASLIKEYVIE